VELSRHLTTRPLVVGHGGVCSSGSTASRRQV
jgi:hypothetical protein